LRSTGQVIIYLSKGEEGKIKGMSGRKKVGGDLKKERDGRVTVPNDFLDT